MPRPLRSFSKSKIYHIITKGNNAEEIFYDNQDRRYFLKQLKETKEKFNFEIFTYCLMSNHVHLVIRIDDEYLSKAVQSLIIRYAYYFNQKYKRVGVFVQNRFKSKNVEDQRYFLEVCRYVHRNPEKAGVAKTQDYPWSSYKEYVGKEEIINKKILLHYFDNDVKKFIKFTNMFNEEKETIDFADYEIMDKLKDDELANIVIKLFNLDSIDEISKNFKDKSNEDKKYIIKKLNEIKGTNVTQLARVTRIGRKMFIKKWK